MIIFLEICIMLKRLLISRRGIGANTLA